MSKFNTSTDRISINGNEVLESHTNRDFPVFLVHVTNKEFDEHGMFAVVTDQGFNPLEGFNEFDYRYFSGRPEAEAAYDKEVKIRN